MVLWRSPAVGTYHDDAIYLVTARALAEGEGYRIISLPDAPPQTKYPILFPWLLSLLWRVTPSFPANLPWLRIVPFIASVAWLVLVARLLLLLGASRREACLLTVVFGASPFTLYFSTALLSEALFGALTAASVLALTLDQRRRLGTSGALTAGLLVGAACLTRAAGVALVAAGCASYLLQRRPRALAVYLVGVALLAGPWVWWVISETDRAAQSGAYYASANYASWNLIAAYTWAEKLRVLFINALLAIIGSATWLGIGPTSWVLLLPGGVFALCASVAIWKQRREPAALTVVGVVLLTLGWVWPPLRLLGPVVPLLLWFAWSTVRAMPRLIASALVSTLLIVELTQAGRMALESSVRGTTFPLVRMADDWGEMSELFAWIRQHTPPESVLTGNLDPTYFLFTGRKAVRGFQADPYLLYYAPRPLPRGPLGTPSDLAARFRQVSADYLVITPGNMFAESVHLRALVSQLDRLHPGLLTPAVGSSSSGYVVYRIDRTRLD